MLDIEQPRSEGCADGLETSRHRLKAFDASRYPLTHLVVFVLRSFSLVLIFFAVFFFPLTAFPSSMTARWHARRPPPRLRVRMDILTGTHSIYRAMAGTPTPPCRRCRHSQAQRLQASFPESPRFSYQMMAPSNGLGGCSNRPIFCLLFASVGVVTALTGIRCQV